jgi:hypothetical protein
MSSTIAVRLLIDEYSSAEKEGYLEWGSNEMAE